VRNSEDERVGALFEAGVKLHRGYRAIFHLQLGGPWRGHLFRRPFARWRTCSRRRVRRAGQRDTHAVSGAIGKERFPKNIDAIASVGLVQLFIQSANEDDPQKRSMAPLVW